MPKNCSVEGTTRRVRLTAGYSIFPPGGSVRSLAARVQGPAERQGEAIFEESKQIRLLPKEDSLPEHSPL